MLFYDSHIAAMRTTIDEAQRLDAGMDGSEPWSEPALLGLLRTDDPVTRRVVVGYRLLARVSAARP